MPKTDASYSPDDYAPVADRISLFYSRFPNGRILTELISRTDSEIVFKAIVFRSPDESGPSATGWASERIGDGDINTVACLENTETSAIGRALANLGLTASRVRPSREEMTKAARERVRAARRAASSTARDPHARRVIENSTYAFDALQHAGDQINDALLLVAEAERAGLAPSRAARLRAKLRSPGVVPAQAERIERLLRSYLAARDERHDLPAPPSPVSRPT